MLKENNTRKGFFEHGDYLALRDALDALNDMEKELKRGFRLIPLLFCWEQDK